MFEVRDLSGNVLPGIPTPRLIEAGGGDAYNIGTIWYVADFPDFVAPNGIYTKVRIVHLDEYRVDVTIKVVGPEPEDPYEDYFLVMAEDSTTASHKGMQAAAEDVVRRNGDEYGSDVTVSRVRAT